MNEFNGVRQNASLSPGLHTHTLTENFKAMVPSPGSRESVLVLLGYWHPSQSPENTGPKSETLKPLLHQHLILSNHIFCCGYVWSNLRNKALTMHWAGMVGKGSWGMGQALASKFWLPLQAGKCKLELLLPNIVSLSLSLSHSRGWALMNYTRATSLQTWKMHRGFVFSCYLIV